MDLDPIWQANYVDLSDERTIRFGAWCVVCSARYASADETLDPALPHSPSPGSAAARAIEETKYRAFVEFDAAVREITFKCRRCRRSACPDCWDEDNRMCGACVQAHGLSRSPRRGLHAAALSDGRLQRIEPGEYNDAPRPGWLDQLIAMQSLEPSNGSAPRRDGGVLSGARARSPERPQFPEQNPPVRVRPQPAVSVPVAAPPPSYVSPLSGATPMSQQGLSRQAPRSGTSARMAAVPRTETGGLRTPEGKATSNMVECPRCHTANYDFVTRCTVCQLQLIQTCPICERLNPGHAAVCEACGSPLFRPSGWSGAHARVAPVAGSRDNKRSRGAQPPKPERRAKPSKPKLRPTGNTGNIRAALGLERIQAPRTEATAPAHPVSPAPQDPLPALAAAAMVAAAALPLMPSAPVPAVHAEQDEDVSTLDMTLLMAERVATIVLTAAILLLVGAIVLAEVSPRADGFFKALIHVDIREAVANFWALLQTLLRRYQKQ